MRWYSKDIFFLLFFWLNFSLMNEKTKIISRCYESEVGGGPCKLLLHFEKPSYPHEKILLYVSSTLQVEIILVPWIWYEICKLENYWWVRKLIINSIRATQSCFKDGILSYKKIYHLQNNFRNIWIPSICRTNCWWLTRSYQGLGNWLQYNNLPIFGREIKSTV